VVSTCCSPAATGVALHPADAFAGTVVVRDDADAGAPPNPSVSPAANANDTTMPAVRTVGS